MNEVLALATLAVLAAVLALTLKNACPPIAFLLALAAGVLILLRAGSAVTDIGGQLTAVLTRGGIGEALYLPVAKVMGVAVVVRVTGALCRDAGQSALAAQIELAGGAAALLLCLPLLEQLLALAEGWL